VVAEEMDGAAVGAELLSLSRPAKVAGGKEGAHHLLLPLALQEGALGCAKWLFFLFDLAVGVAEERSREVVSRCARSMYWPLQALCLCVLSPLLA
jgi:hypothetical protein